MKKGIGRLIVLLSVVLLGCFVQPNPLFQVFIISEKNKLGELSKAMVDTSNNLYVIGGDKDKIFIIDNNGKHKLLYQSSGNMSKLIDFVIDNRGRIFVLEENGHVLIISTEGKLIKDLHINDVGFTSNSIGIDSKYNIYITDPENQRIIAYSIDGNYIKEYKDTKHISVVHAIFIDSNDIIYNSMTKLGCYWNKSDGPRWQFNKI